MPACAIAPHAGSVPPTPHFALRLRVPRTHVLLHARTCVQVVEKAKRTMAGIFDGNGTDGTKAHIMNVFGNMYTQKQARHMPRNPLTDAPAEEPTPSPLMVRPRPRARARPRARTRPRARARARPRRATVRASRLYASFTVRTARMDPAGDLMLQKRQRLAARSASSYPFRSARIHRQ